MDFNTIRPYTSDGTYRVDVPLNQIEEAIQRYEDNYGLEVNPDFQRGHIWDEDRQIAFVEHLLRGGQGSNELRFNCTNWMRWRGKINRNMVLVDGLQRLTAIRRFLNGEIGIFDGHYIDEIDNLPLYHVTMSFRVNDLATRREVLNWYIEINEGGVVHTEDEINRVKELLERENKCEWKN